MARVKLSALIISISGRYAGGVFRAWKGLTVLSALPSSVLNPNSDKQAERRAILSCASKIWAGLGTAGRTLWGTVAEYLTLQWGNYENEVGTHSVIRTPRGPYTKLGALTSVCGLLATVDQWDCEDVPPAIPAGHTAPSPPTTVAATGDTDGIVVTWTDPGSWGDQEEDGFVRVWFKSDDGFFFSQLYGFAAGGVETLTITEGVPAGGAHAVPLRVGYYYIQCDAVNDGGLRSGPSNVFEIQIDAPVPP